MSGYLSNLAVAFARVAGEHASRDALRYSDGQTVTYGALDARSNQIARMLVAQGVGSGIVVGVFHDKSPDAFAAMLACLKIGAIYTNLDPSSPWERVRRILSTCEPRLVLAFASDIACEAELASSGIDLVRLQRDDQRRQIDLCDAAPVSDLDAILGSHPAYIMFTSGSTGVPKGAVISHANVLNFVAWGRERFAVAPNDVLSNANPMYFDNSVFDFYTAIFSGATLVPLSAEQVRDPRALVAAVDAAKCTIWFSVPSLLVYLLTTRALRSENFVTLRKIIFGGEGFPKAKLKQLYDLYGSRTDLENVYGPTECTCICSAYTIGPSDFTDMSELATLGHLAKNFSYEILPLDDAHPETGELFLLGPNVGLGYYNDVERSAKAFVQNPRHDRYRDIGYRTGDLVRRDARGQLHFKGRADFQIKHMGYRIELEEIEAAINSISGVSECAVIYRQVRDGLGEILGFAATNGVDGAELVMQVGRRLPAYMVPRRIVVLDVIPKNANGKIDRTALGAMETAST